MFALENVSVVLFVFSREITRMKQARGAGGLPGADDDDFTVVPVESTSESTEC